MDEKQTLREAFARNPKAASKIAELIESGKLKFEQPDENEELHVLCVRWPGLVDDCSREQCGTCGSDVAVAPSTRDMVRRQKVPPFYQCVECVTLPVH